MSKRKGWRVALGLVLTAAACVAVAPSTQAASRDRVVYVFEADTAAKDSFKTLMNNQGYGFRGLRLDRVSGFDFSATDVIIVAADTNYSSVGFASEEAAAAIDAADKPVIGLGYGGSMLFDHMAPEFGYNTSAEGSSRAVIAATVRDQVWQEPFALASSEEERQKVYTEGTTFVGIWDGSATTAVRPIGKKVYDRPNFNQTYLPIAKGSSTDGTQIFVWGFNGSPETMTKGGKRLFVNAVDTTISVR